MSSMPQSNEDPRRPEEIEDDIERTRAEVSSTLDAIQSRLTPGQMMDQALQYLRSSGTAAVTAPKRSALMKTSVKSAFMAWQAPASC